MKRKYEKVKIWFRDVSVIASSLSADDSLYIYKKKKFLQNVFPDLYEPYKK